MIRFLCSSSAKNRFINNTQLFQLQLGYLQFGCDRDPNHSFVSDGSGTRSFTSEALPNSDERLKSSVSYLVKSCGLSTENAILVCKTKNLKLANPEKADSVLEFFRAHGFTDAQITRCVRKSPQLLLADLDKKLKPKFEFFYSKGISRADLPIILASNSSLLQRSLDNFLVPSYNILKSVTGLDDAKIIMALRHWQWGKSSKTASAMQENLVPNLELLRGLGVPQSSISLLLTGYLITACLEPKKFGQIVQKVRVMGFSPSQVSFVIAIHVLAKVGKPSWESKLEIYRRYGCSNEDAQSAFRRTPWFMLVSDKKIEQVMDFLINKMGWSVQDVAKFPSILSLSLGKRIMPRCSVAYVLLSKGIVQKDLHLSSLLCPKENAFVEKFVTKYLVQVPELLNVYLGKIGPRDVGV